MCSQSSRSISAAIMLATNAVSNITYSILLFLSRLKGREDEGNGKNRKKGRRARNEKKGKGKREGDRKENGREARGNEENGREGKGKVGQGKGGT